MPEMLKLPPDTALHLEREINEVAPFIPLLMEIDRPAIEQLGSQYPDVIQAMEEGLSDSLDALDKVGLVASNDNAKGFPADLRVRYQEFDDNKAQILESKMPYKQALTRVQSFARGIIWLRGEMHGRTYDKNKIHEFSQGMDAAIKLIEQAPKSECIPREFLHCMKALRVLAVSSTAISYDDAMRQASRPELRRV